LKQSGIEAKECKTGILALVPDLWGNLWQSRHYVMRGLSEHFKVLWVSPPAYWHSWLNGKASASLSGRGLRKVSDAFWTYAPRLPADYKPRYTRGGLVAGGFRYYHALWQKRHVARIRQLLRQMGVGRVILYIWRPEFAWSLGRFAEALTCYHVDDEYSFNPSQDMPTSQEEMLLLKRSDIVFIHSRTLMQKKGMINPNTHYMPNGVDFEHYRRVMESPAAEPQDLKDIPRPRIGYVGYIKRHIDLPLMLAIARAHRDWSIVLIGPVRAEHNDIAEDIARLRQEPNVHFLGAKPQSELPAYIKGLEVCLMCYRETNYTKYIYPMKLHEYLSCGKPVVATPLENLKEFSNVLRFARTPEEWLAAIQAGLQDTDQGRYAARISVARENSWVSRVKQISQCVQESIRQ
jgi:glycosyltransferase involved in cell wall biosynthesis